jgi:nucleoside-diphosphate-sugar epimerase
VLITGGNGFIGSHLSEELVNRNDSVSLLDVSFNSNTESIDCKKIRGDIRNYNVVKKAIYGVDAVFHFAAMSRVVWGQKQPLNCWRTNVLGTLNVLEACRKAKSKPVIFYASSREVYGEPQYLPVDESHPKNPKSIYGVSKLCAEKACFSFYNSFGLRIVIFRFSNVYGSERDQLDRVIPKFMLRALRDEDITLYGGDQVLDFTFIDDTISGILNAYDKSFDDERNVVGESFHFVTGRGVSALKLAKMIADICCSSSKIIRREPKDFDVQAFIGDPTKAYRIINYEPRIRLEDGLEILKERILRNEVKLRS